MNEQPTKATKHMAAANKKYLGLGPPGTRSSCADRTAMAHAHAVPITTCNHDTVGLLLPTSLCGGHRHG